MEIKPYAKNAKKHPAYQLQQIANSVKEFGWQQPIVVDKEGTIIVGHGRYEAYKRYNLEEPPIQVADLTEEQAKAYRLADNKQDTIWNVNRPSKSEAHPTMKPIELIEKAIINSSKQEDTILDLFLGSGSTLIAAEKTGRICYGMELDPKYVDVIVQRYVDYTGNTEVIKNGKPITWQAKKQENQ